MADQPRVGDGVAFNFVGNLAWVLVFLGGDALYAGHVWSGLGLWLLSLVAFAAVKRWPEINPAIRSWRTRSPMISTAIVAILGALVFGSAWWFLVGRNPPAPVQMTLEMPEPKESGFTWILHITNMTGKDIDLPQMVVKLRTWNGVVRAYVDSPEVRGGPMPMHVEDIGTIYPGRPVSFQVPHFMEMSAQGQWQITFRLTSKLNKEFAFEKSFCWSHPWSPGLAKSCK